MEKRAAEKPLLFSELQSFIVAQLISRLSKHRCFTGQERGSVTSCIKHRFFFYCQRTAFRQHFYTTLPPCPIKYFSSMVLYLDLSFHNNISKYFELVVYVLHCYCMIFLLHCFHFLCFLSCVLTCKGCPEGLWHY